MIVKREIRVARGLNFVTDCVQSMMRADVDGTWWSAALFLDTLQRIQATHVMEIYCKLNYKQILFILVTMKEIYTKVQNVRLLAMNLAQWFNIINEIKSISWSLFMNFMTHRDRVE